MNFKRYTFIALAMLAIDWALGALHVAGAVPLWSFLVLNFPFGLPFIWLESHWAGTYYSIAGQGVNDMWSFAAFFFSVFAQAWLYLWLLEQRRRSGHGTPAAQRGP